MKLYLLGDRPLFPPPEDADPSGLLAVGGDLTVPWLVQAYRHGVFPWFNDGEPILWWSPNPRLILPLDGLHISRSLRKTIRQRRFEVRIDTDFAGVIAACAATPRPGQDGTWITSAMQAAYVELHRRGYAHSVESYADGRLVGGIYGVALGRGFFGESMFAHRSDASKVALEALVRTLRARGSTLFDCQVRTDHTASMGGVEVSRTEFLHRLAQAVSVPTDISPWRLPPLESP